VNKKKLVFEKVVLLLLMPDVKNVRNTVWKKPVKHRNSLSVNSAQFHLPIELLW